MKLRDFDPAQEKLAAEWARVALVPHEGWVNSAGQTLEEAAIEFSRFEGHDRHRERLGYFKKKGVQIFAKARDFQTAKVVSDVCYAAGLPVAPEAVTEIQTPRKPLLVNLSMVPFKKFGTSSDFMNAHSITTMAAIIGSWVSLFNMQDHADICFSLKDGLEMSDLPGALFDYDTAFSEIENSESVLLQFPAFADVPDIKLDVAAATVEKITSLDPALIMDIVGRLPEKFLIPQRDRIPHYLVAAQKRMPGMLRNLEELIARP